MYEIDYDYDYDYDENAYQKEIYFDTDKIIKEQLKDIDPKIKKSILKYLKIEQ